jgi:toluene monooxygenase system protein E
MGERRVPSDYEIATSKLLWHPRSGFEVNVPLASWYARWQQGSLLVADDWERFADPRATTYASYVDLERASESHVDKVLERADESREDATMDPAWRSVLARAFAPLRFPFHGLQMVAAYVGHMAPSGKITVAAAFQAADEMRRIQRIAYRMAQLAQHAPGFGDASRELWENDRAWQPMRECIERLLVAWDWGEALVALAVCVKPVLDDVTMKWLPEIAAARRDHTMGALCHALEEDCRWHRAWTAALLRTAFEQKSANRDVARAWVDVWWPRAIAAGDAWASLLDASSPRATLEKAHHERLIDLGLERA